MGSTTRKPQRGLGYSIEEIQRQSGTRYRAYVWNTVAKKKEPVAAPDGSKTFQFWEQAEAAAIAVRRRVDSGYRDAGISVQRQAQRQTFDQYADYWAPTVGGTTRTRNQRRALLRVFGRNFGSKMMDEFTEVDFRRWDADLEARGLSTSYRQQFCWVLGKMFAQAAKDEVCLHNPTEGLWVKAYRTRQPRYLSQQELYLLLSFMPMWFWPAALLSYFCGLRAAEIAGLRWERLDLDSDNPSVLVTDVMDPGRVPRSFTKGPEDQSEPVAMPPIVVTALKVLRAWRGRGEKRSDFVFRNSRNQPISHNAPNNMLREAFELSGLDGERPVWQHLRHTTAARLAAAGAPAHVIKSVLRHKSLSTSQKYIPEVKTATQRAWMMGLAQCIDEHGYVVVMPDDHAPDNSNLQKIAS